MSALIWNLRSLIQHDSCISFSNHKLFCHAETTPSRSRGVGLSSGHHSVFDVWHQTLVLQLPNMSSKSCVVLPGSVLKITFVIIHPSFQRCGCRPIVQLSYCPWCCYSGLIYNLLPETNPTSWARPWPTSTIALWRFFTPPLHLLFFSQRLLVVGCQDGLDISRAAVWKFDCILVKQSPHKGPLLVF